MNNMIPDASGRGWRARSHDAGLIFCSAVAAYLLSVLFARLVGVPLALAVRTVESLAARVALGVVALDLTRLPALLAVAWAVGSAVRFPPLGSSLALVLLVYGIDLAVVLIMGQAGPLYGSLPVVLCRLAAAALLVWLTVLVFRRRQR